MIITVHPRDVAQDNILETISGRDSGLYLTSQIPGGFGECGFLLGATPGQQYEWLANRFGCRIRVSEGARLAWEGRVERVFLREAGVRVVAYGYQRNCYDEHYMDALATTPTAYTRSEQADVTIKHALTNHCDQINSDQSNIDSTTFALGSIIYNTDQYPGEVFSYVASLSDDADNTWDWAVWDNRIFWFKKRVPTKVDWECRLADIQTEWELERNVLERYSRLGAIHTVAGVKTYTATAADADSATKYGSRTRFITLGAVAAATAASARDRALAQMKDPMQGSPFILTRVFEAGKGMPQAPRGLWEVRAGSVIRIVDLFPTAAGLTSVALDAMSTFFVRSTRYDAADTDRLMIQPDQPSRDVSAMLAREGITGNSE